MHQIQGDATLSSLSLQPVPAKPVTSRRVADTQALSNLLDGQALANEGFELSPRDTAFRRVPTRTVCRQAVLLQPVAHRRRVFASQFADRFQRHPFRQATLQKSLVHAQIIAFASDRTLRWS
jgi:hypothetical protein